MKPIRHLHRSLGPMAGLWLAALLLAAQAAGWSHRIAHAGLQPARLSAGMVVAVVASPSSPAVAAPLAAALRFDASAFTGHTQAGAECRLLDHLLGAGDSLLSGAGTPGVAPCPPHLAARADLPDGAAAKAVYQARAPPSA